MTTPTRKAAERRVVKMAMAWYEMDGHGNMWKNMEIVEKLERACAALAKLSRRKGKG